MPKKIRLKKKKPFYIITLLLLLLSLFAVGFIWAWNSNTNVLLFSNIVEFTEQKAWAQINLADFSSNIEKIANSSKNSSQINSLKDFNYLVTTDLNWTDQNETQNNIQLVLDGYVDENFHTQLTSKAHYQNPNVKLDAEGDVRLIDNIIYVKPTLIPLFNMNDNDIWYSTDLSSYKDKFSQENQQENILKFLTEPEVLNKIEKYPDMIIGTVRTNCFGFTLDNNEIETLKDLATQDLEFQSYPSSKITLKQTDIKFCFGRRDHQPYYIESNASINAPNISTKDIQITTTINFSDYDKEKSTVKKPTNISIIDPALIDKTINKMKNLD